MATITPEQTLEIVEQTLRTGWAGGDVNVVPDHIRGGYIEATLWTDVDGRDVQVATLRITVEVTS